MVEGTGGYPRGSMNRVSQLTDFVRSDAVKLLRFAAVSLVTVPLGLFLLWFFVDVVGMRPALANVVGVTLSTIPNYILNRYWVWNKRSANSVKGEIAPFWAIAFAGLLLSTVLVAIAARYTDATIVYLAANFFSFGVMWLVKFFVLEKYLFGPTPRATT